MVIRTLNFLDDFYGFWGIQDTADHSSVAWNSWKTLCLKLAGDGSFGTIATSSLHRWLVVEPFKTLGILLFHTFSEPVHRWIFVDPNSGH